MLLRLLPAELALLRHQRSGAGILPEAGRETVIHLPVGAITWQGTAGDGLSFIIKMKTAARSSSLSVSIFRLDGRF